MRILVELYLRSWFSSHARAEKLSGGNRTAVPQQLGDHRIKGPFARQLFHAAMMLEGARPSLTGAAVDLDLQVDGVSVLGITPLLVRRPKDRDHGNAERL